MITLPFLVTRRFEAADIACLAVTSIEPGLVRLSAAPADALARAELSVMLALLSADLACNPHALMPLPFGPPPYVQHRSVLHDIIEGPSGL